MRNKFRLLNRLHYKSAECSKARGECLLSVWNNPLPGSGCHKKVCYLQCDEVGSRQSSSPGPPRVTLQEALFCVKWESAGGLDTTVKNKGTAGGEI